MSLRRWALAAIAAVALAACEEEAPRPEPSPPAETTAPPTTAPPTTEEPSPAATAEPEPEFDAIGGTEVEHGGSYWAVYLAVGDYDAPELEQASDYLSGLGIESFAGDLACDRGAQAALGPDAGPAGVAAYFRSRHDAQAFAESLPSPPAGIAKVKTYCAD